MSDQPFTPVANQPGFSFYAFNQEFIIGPKCTIDFNGLLDCKKTSNKPNNTDLICNYTMNWKSDDGSLSLIDDDGINSSEINKHGVNMSTVVCYTFEYFEDEYLPKQITSDKFTDKNIESINKRIFLSRNDPFKTPFSTTSTIGITGISPNNSSGDPMVTVDGYGFLGVEQLIMFGIPDAKNNVYFLESDLIPNPNPNENYNSDIGTQIFIMNQNEIPKLRI